MDICLFSAFDIARSENLTNVLCLLFDVNAEICTTSPLGISAVATRVAGNEMTTLIDTVALDTANIAVGCSVISTAIVFGIKLEDISPLSCLITATGTIVKL